MKCSDKKMLFFGYHESKTNLTDLLIIENYAQVLPKPTIFSQSNMRSLRDMPLPWQRANPKQLFLKQNATEIIAKSDLPLDKDHDNFYTERPHFQRGSYKNYIRKQDNYAQLQNWKTKHFQQRFKPEVLEKLHSPNLDLY